MKTPAVHALTLMVGVAAVVVGGRGVLGVAGSLRVPWLLAFGGLELAVDPLSGLFLALIGGISIPTSIYAMGEGRPRRAMALTHLVFVGSMGLVVVAANVMTFLVAWEVMSVASYLMIVSSGETESLRAAWVYAVMTHAGLACLVLGMLLLGVWTGSLRFGDWHLAGAGLTPVQRHVAFVLLAVGFATKAGVIPLHVWLPLAHPAAPSPVSALMSGVMIKLGVYGLIRLGVDWLGGGPAWWGVLILVAGAVSALVGVLYALVEHDLKRLLAFHSIENVGIILLGLGAALLFQQAGLGTLATLALTAGLYHTVNHAVFKALLFLGAGAVLHSTGTRDMERMGGLIKRMPWTAACFLIGAAAISALPPLNGFVSEWLTFQALLQNVWIPSPGINLAFTVGIAALALTSGLAAACFVKAFGITFLALPRDAVASRAEEVSLSMRGGMMVLAAACLLLGLGATWATPLIASVATSTLGLPAPLELGTWLVLGAPTNFATLSMLVLAGLLGAGALAPLGGLVLFGRARRHRLYETWGCGRIVQTARMEYTAMAFANPFKRVFDFFYRPTKQLDIEFHPESRFFVERIEYENPTRSIFDEWLYRPLLGALRRVAHRVRAIQSGSANLYLTYILAVLLLMLLLGMIPVVLVAALHLLVMALGAPLVIGLIRTVKARLMGRQGPMPWQPYRDLAKLFGKEVVVSATTSWVFRATPYVLTASMLTASLLVPLVAARPGLGRAGGIIATMYVLLLGTFFLALAGLDSGSAFGGMGSSRAMAVAALAEPTLIVAVFALSMSAGTTNLGQLVERLADQPGLLLNPGHLLAFAALFIVMLAETGRLPVDNPATHLELTMIHEAMILEYSGRYLALIEWASAMKLLLFMALLGNLFVPWGMARTITPWALLGGLVALGGKVVVLAGLVALIETAVAKLRLFRVPELLAGSFALALLSVISVLLLR